MAYQVTEGSLSAGGMKFAVVVARFNSFITDRLLAGAVDAVCRSGGTEEQMEVFRVPGAWELGVTARALLRAKAYDAVICLGAVVRGDTPHFDYVAGQTASALSGLSMETGVPVVFGVLTTNSVEQAIDRAGAKSGNKGFDAALTAIEMVSLLRKIGGGR